MDVCSEAGPVKFFRLVADSKSGEPKGFAFCEYFDIASVQNAIRVLNNREVMGRKIRIDYASDQATTGSEGKPGVIRQAGNSQAVGMDAAKISAQNMQMLLPGSTSSSPPSNQPDTITSIIAGMSRPDLYAIISQVKSLIQQDPAQVRALLTAQPNLARALFQAQVALGMLPLPQTNGSLPHAAAPGAPSHQQPQSAHAGMSQGQQHQMAPGSGGVGPGGMMQYPAQSQQQMGPAQGQSQVSDPRSDPRRSFQQMQAGQAGHVAAGDSAHNHQAYAGPAPGQMGNMLPQQSASQPNFGQVHQQQPQLQQQQQPQQPQPQQQPPSQPQQQQQAQFGLAQQQALLQQVMNLTPQQIDLLPEQQKQQVLTLQKQMRGHTG